MGACSGHIYTGLTQAQAQKPDQCTLCRAGACSPSKSAGKSSGCATHRCHRPACPGWMKAISTHRLGGWGGRKPRCSVQGGRLEGGWPPKISWVGGWNTGGPALAARMDAGIYPPCHPGTHKYVPVLPASSTDGAGGTCTSTRSIKRFFAHRPPNEVPFVAICAKLNV